MVSHSGILLLLLALRYLCAVHGNAELIVLMRIKSALDPKARILTSWISNGAPCGDSFEGVACNEHGKVANISLQGKGLAGSIPPAISGLKCLSGLFLHYNSLLGEIPEEISNLTELTELYLNNNNLSGRIPARIGNMTNLQVLQLSYNQLTGGIPTQLGLLKKLTLVSLQSNLLTGAIPASLGDLTRLEMIDLSFNHLFGSIPVELAYIGSLEVLDLRNNTLSGNVPLDFKRLQGGFKYGNNTGLCGAGFPPIRACSSENQGSFGSKPTSLNIPQTAELQMKCNTVRCSSKFSKTSKMAIIFGSILVAIIGMIIFVAFSLHRHRKQKIESVSEPSDSHLNTDQVKDVCRSASPLISLEYSNNWDAVLQGFNLNLEDIEYATQYFSKVNLLGRNNFAATYKGVLRDRSVVAIKSLNKSSCKMEEAEFMKGLNVITSLQHENLVELRGFCYSRGREKCFLMYNFIPNGKLSRYLDLKDENCRVLDWITRVSLVEGIAKGLEYLHSNRANNKPVVVHQNISSENILIDENFKPRISDSGLHKLLADDIVFSTLKSSAAEGYLAPEYTTIGRFTEKSDVYSFGMLVFRILSGTKRITNQMQFAAECGKIEELIDHRLQNKFSENEAVKLSKIASQCTNEAPNLRPSMLMVVDQLSQFVDSY